MSKTATLIEMAIKADVVPFIMGKFGIGKSSIVASVANKLNLKLIDVRLGNLDPTDLTGIPFKVERTEDGKTMVYVEHITNAMFPIEGNPLPYKYDQDGQPVLDKKGNHVKYAGWLVNFDELTSVVPMLQNSAYRILREREVAMHKLHPNVYMTAAGNREADLGAQELTKGIRTRVTMIEHEVSADEWLKWAVHAGISPYVTAYIKHRPSMLDQLDVEAATLNYAVPRTWEMASNFLLDYGTPMVNPMVAPLLEGCLGVTAIDFIAYLAYLSDLPTAEEIIKDPLGTKLPSESGHRYALTAMCADYLLLNFTATKKGKSDAVAILEYTKRMRSPEMVVATIQPSVAAHNDILSVNEIMDWVMDNKAFFGDVAEFRKQIGG